jgi:hypothetical protein
MSAYERPGERLITVERFGQLRDDDTRMELVRGRVVGNYQRAVGTARSRCAWAASFED